jgi:alpha-ketoglutarate-dependent taurine dioxygenase
VITTSLPAHGRPFVLVEGKGQRLLDALDPARIFDLYRQHGALLLRGLSADLVEFSTFVRQFCPVAVQNESGNRAKLDENSDIQSVNLGTRPFPLHPELSREPWKPDSCFFFCISPPSRGGLTTLCDGVDIVRRLPDPIRRAMEGRRLRYILPAPPEVLAYWLGTATPTDDDLSNPPLGCPFTFERNGGRVVRIFTRPLLHRPMFTDEPAFGNFLLFARYLRGIRTFPLLDDGQVVPDEWIEAVKAASDPITVPVDWRKQDLLMLDNSRFMHGRTAVDATDDRVIATYFGYLKNAAPQPEEPADPAWRRPGFRPPVPLAPSPV